MPLDPDRKYKFMSDAQAEFIADLVNAKFTEDDPARELLRNQFRAIASWRDVQAMIEMLKELPTLVQQAKAADELQRVAREASKPTEEGLYRNPETGELYRIKRSGLDLIISKYSKTGGPRRLVDGEIVKGKFERWTAFNSRMAFHRGEIKKDWLIDPKTLAQDYAYGFCPLHFGPLSDAVSVILGYGPDCAEKHGLPWSQQHAEAILASQKEARA